MIAKRLIKFCVLFTFLTSCTITKEVTVFVPVKVPIPAATAKIDSAKATNTFIVNYDFKIDSADKKIKPVKSIHAILDTGNFGKVQSLHVEYSYPQDYFYNFFIVFKPDTLDTVFQTKVKIEVAKPSWKETYFWTIIITTTIVSAILAIIFTAYIRRVIL
jgi:hypothetical protein